MTRIPLLKRYVVIVLLVATVGVTHQPETSRPSDPPRIVTSTATNDELWDTTVAPYLEQPLWTNDEAYDAGHYLMVPLHAAFVLDHSAWQQAFSEHFARFVHRPAASLPSQRIARFQYLYLASQFMVLAAQTGKAELIPSGLAEALYQDLLSEWTTTRAPHWDTGMFPSGAPEGELVRWKLSVTPQTTELSYYSAITDTEIFLLAIAADLRQLERRLAFSAPEPRFLDELLETARTIFSTRVEHTDTGWLLQPGYWVDHVDYLYAGNATQSADLHARKVPNIAEDTAHSHRLALWLGSFAGAFSEAEERALFDNLRRGLDRQFFDVALVGPTARFPSYRTTNYMDGSNGVYRWGSQNQGVGRGYGPYELSGTLTLGWWSFLQSTRACQLYDDLASRFPLPRSVLNVYVGPNTRRARNALVALPASYENGFQQLIVRLAASVARGAGCAPTDLAVLRPVTPLAFLSPTLLACWCRVP